MSRLRRRATNRELTVTAFWLLALLLAACSGQPPPTATQIITPTPSRTPTVMPIATDPPNLHLTDVIDGGLWGPNQCHNHHVIVESPFSGATVSGRVPILGTVSLFPTDYYKFDLRAEGDPDWHVIYRRNGQAWGELMTWETSTVTPGRYDLRLVAVNVATSGEYWGVFCTITVNVER